MEFNKKIVSRMKRAVSYSYYHHNKGVLFVVYKNTYFKLTSFV